MIIFKQLVLGSFLVFAMLSLQACFWSGPSGQYASTTHTLCDNNGGNCLACDDNQNCHRTDAQDGTPYGPSRHAVCDAEGENCLNCDLNNTNCQSTARSYWGFIF